MTAALCAAVFVSLAACGDRALSPAAPSALSLAGGRNASPDSQVVGGADYHDPYPAPGPEPAPPGDETPMPPGTDPAPPGSDPAPPATTVAFTLMPDVGSAMGGTAVTISGMSVVEGATVTFSGVPATDVVIVDAMSLTAVTPAGAEGLADVVVTLPDGHAHTLTGGYTYVADLPLDQPATITITPDGITPRAIQIAVGAQVVFVNNDVRMRSPQSDPHPTHRDCPELNVLGFIAPGASAQTREFGTPRVCTFHDHNDPDNVGLQGRIVIR